MKNIILVLAATVICGACLFTSCKKDEETGNSDLRVAEKIIGKWVRSEVDGQPVPTNEKMVITFVSTTQGYLSAALNFRPEAPTLWANQKKVAVAIEGNKVTVTNQQDEHTTGVEEHTVTAISDNDFSANHKVTVTVDGNVVMTDERVMRYTEVTADYSDAILGLWECQGITGGETNNDDNARLEFMADGTYRFYRRSDAGVWSLVPRERNEYFVDGNLLCTRWQTRDEGGTPWDYTFCPQADYYMKAHLFGDIYASDQFTPAERELVTVAALSAMDGVEPQFEGHKECAVHMGNTPEQVDYLCHWLSVKNDK